MEEFQKFFDELGKWSDETFGKRKDPIGLLNHLKEEVEELLENPHDKEEYADALMLLLDAYRIKGGSLKSLLNEAKLKLTKNKQREWGNFDENGVSNHIREYDVSRQNSNSCVLIKKKDLDKLKEKAKSKRPNSIEITIYERVSDIKFLPVHIKTSSSLSLDENLFKQIRNIAILHKDTFQKQIYKKVEKVWDAAQENALISIADKKRRERKKILKKYKR